MKKTYLQSLFEEHRQSERCPSPARVTAFFNHLLGFLFPEFSEKQIKAYSELEQLSDSLMEEFSVLLRKCSDHTTGKEHDIARQFWQALPDIREKLKKDIQAIYDGDPAAKSMTEVIRTYPGFYAITSYRLAHFLHNSNYKLLARMITENAHSRTGIDIHPGARIGDYFCVDHGTGIVIGETTDIGKHVKIYQGVTLGALSVRKEDAAVKRHPTIGDYVVIYAGASILGGDTTVGKHSVIGGNVWLTHSVPDYSRISYVAHQENRAISEENNSE